MAAERLISSSWPLPAELLACTGRFYIDGQWVAPSGTRTLALIDPGTEQPIARIALAECSDVEAAVASARGGFDRYAGSSVSERSALLGRIAERLRAHRTLLARALTAEMGAPIQRTLQHQTGVALAHLEEMIRVLEHYAFESRRARTLVVREPIGVCALITPWNAPLMQIATKAVPALAAGCSMILKPSEQAPLSAILWTQLLHEAGVPPGVFNLVQGMGDPVGELLAAHPGIDMVSFTGSTRAGVRVAELAAGSVKRVHQELGGKAANILLDDADLERAVTQGVGACYGNSGQSCIAPDRMLIAAACYHEAIEIAVRAATAVTVGDPWNEATMLGPVVNARQFERVQGHIALGIQEGARLLVGGPGRPAGLERGYFVRPTLFAEVSPSMTIAREELFGPVLLLMRYRSEEEAVQIANATPYGLAAYVQSADPARAERLARRLRVGYVYVNGAPPDYSAPFGGYKCSGNGREYGEWGLEAFLELKSIVGTSSQLKPVAG